MEKEGNKSHLGSLCKKVGEAGPESSSVHWELSGPTMSLCIDPSKPGGFSLHQQNLPKFFPNNRRKACLVEKHWQKWLSFHEKVSGSNRSRNWCQGLGKDDEVSLAAWAKSIRPSLRRWTWLPLPCSLPIESLEIRLLIQASRTCSQAITLFFFRCSSVGSAVDVDRKPEFQDRKKKVLDDIIVIKTAYSTGYYYTVW